MTTLAVHPLLAELRQAREARGVPRRVLAERLGVSRVTIQFWECGYRNPGLAALSRWSAELGLELALTPRAKERAA